MLDAFVPASPALIGSGETVEQRRGEKLSAKSVNRDPVRSPHTYPVKASGLRWVSLMMLACQALAGAVAAHPRAGGGMRRHLFGTRMA
jgi:hypothetical protein